MKTSLLLSILTIRAHVTANPSFGPAGGYFVTFFRIAHACAANENTTSVDIEIPDGIYTVKPKNTAGWTYNITTVTLASPITSGESPVTSKVTMVTFISVSGLPNDAYDDLGLNFQLPDKAGTSLFFKTTQHCTSNTTAWVNIPDNNDVSKWGATPKPAPYVQIQAASSPSTDTASVHDSTVMGISVAGTQTLI